ncbi:MAG: polysaccharide biosynthesis/export family protein [Pseudomonadota bacterium]
MVFGREFKAVVALLASCFLTACGTSTLDSAVGSLPAKSNATAAGLTSGPELPVYKIGARTKLKITVFKEEDLSGVYSTDASGRFALPLIGEVKANGLSARELETEVTTRLKGRYLVDPKVTVVVENYTPFYTMGEVKRVGEHQFQEGLNVVGAVAIAGGYTPRGNTRYVYIRRVGEDKEREVPVATSVYIYPGDTIRIPERYF